MTAAAFGDRNVALTPRRSTTWRDVRRRTYSVRALRVGLLAAMLAIVGYVAFHLVTNIIDPPVTVEPPEDLQSTVRMINPRFTGRDAGGTPYVISANAAVRGPGADGVTTLEQPMLLYDGGDGERSEVRADRGAFNRAEGTLDLFGAVSFTTDGGYAFETSQARVFMDDGRVSGSEPVTGRGPLGAVQAQSFEIWDSGRRVVFRSDVVARLENEDRTPAPDLRTDATEEDPIQ